MSEGELCWGTAGNGIGKVWLWLEEERFDWEPTAYEHNQEQKHKEDGKREDKLPMTWVQCNGDRQHDHKGDSK